jgi:aminoglycoside 6'-N-acetyltransferase
MTRPTELMGTTARLRPARPDDVADLVRIRMTPEVFSRWGGEDLAAEIAEDLADTGTPLFVIEHDGRVVGAIQYGEEPDPQYRHASVDIYVDPAVHRRGIGADAIRTLVGYLFNERRHHRVVIDPAADNVAAIACYTSVGFTAVGIMRDYERGTDGTFHDGLLMELLARDLT